MEARKFGASGRRGDAAEHPLDAIAKARNSSFSVG
jgi:hypothetical protein